MIRYEAHVIGHEAPYRWEVQRFWSGVGNVMLRECVGFSESYEDALFDAADCAREAEYKRKHGAHKVTQPLFEVSEESEDVQGF